jgi:hypothetical protein
MPINGNSRNDALRWAEVPMAASPAGDTKSGSADVSTGVDIGFHLKSGHKLEIGREQELGKQNLSQSGAASELSRLPLGR